MAKLQNPSAPVRMIYNTKENSQIESHLLKITTLWSNTDLCS
jgi:hypothetical protein